MNSDSPIQGILDFQSGNPNGFENWRREREARLEAIRLEWGLPVGHPVRVQLRDIHREIEGRLELVHDPGALDHRVPLRLRLDGFEFPSSDIERCVRLD